MLSFQLPTNRIEYLQLAFSKSGLGLVVRWGTQTTPFTVGTWNDLGSPTGWQITGQHLHLSPDGEWVSEFDKNVGEVRITRVGSMKAFAIVARNKADANVWTAVAPGGTALAWKDQGQTIVRALPGGKPIARVKTGFGFDLRFSSGGRWLTEVGERVFRVFDRADDYRLAARIKTPSYFLADVSDEMSAAVTSGKGNKVEVWDMSSKAATASLKVGGTVSALAISGDGRRLLTANIKGEVTLWDAIGTEVRRYDWRVKAPIAVALALDGTRAAVGGTSGQIVIWDLDH